MVDRISFTVSLYYLVLLSQLLEILTLRTEYIYGGHLYYLILFSKLLDVLTVQTEYILRLVYIS